MSDRKRKTPAQRAQDQYDVAVRIADRLTDQAKKARAEATRLEAELADAVVRRDYAAKHPDLPKQQTPGTATRTTDKAGDTTT